MLPNGCGPEGDRAYEQTEAQLLPCVTYQAYQVCVGMILEVCSFALYEQHIMELP